MYKAKFLGKVVRITWAELRNLKARFNTKNFKKSGEVYSNERKCILCENHSVLVADCGKCPMDVFNIERRASGCMVLINGMLKVKSLQFGCYQKRIQYYDERGKKQLDRVYAFFNRFKKV
jgi:hypothetical protein